MEILANQGKFFDEVSIECGKSNHLIIKLVNKQAVAVKKEAIIAR